MIAVRKALVIGSAMLMACALGWSALAAAQVPVPELTGHVIDLTGTLTVEQKATLEQALTAFEARKGSQLAVLMVASTAPEEVEQFALRVAEKWKLGRKRVDDGAILVVAKDDRAVRIEVGYGLEGALNDLASSRIISETVLPRFKTQDFYGGITAGVGQMIGVVDGEPLPEPSNSPTRRLGGVQQYAPVLFVLALAVGGVLRGALGKVPGSLVTGGVVAVIAWFVVGTVSMALGARPGGGDHERRTHREALADDTQPGDSGLSPQRVERDRKGDQDQRDRPCRGDPVRGRGLIGWHAAVQGTVAQGPGIELFAQLGVWDTEHNNGLLIYLLLADRAVEIVADRGIHSKVGAEDWRKVCHQMEAAFKESNYEGGVVLGVQAVTQHLARFFPADDRANELQDRSIVL